MSAKTYIPVFFLLIFFGKFLSVDSALPQLFFDAENVVFINPFCERKKSKTSKNTAFSEASALSVIPINSFCDSVFTIDLFGWEKAFISTNFKKYNYLLPNETAIHSAKFHPPPQV